MTEEVTGQQPEPQGETASTTNDNNFNTENKPIIEEKPVEPSKDDNNPLVGVISALRRDKREIAEELERTKAERDALKAGNTTFLTEAEINKKAEQLVEIRLFNQKCDDIAAKGKQEFPEFNTALANLNAVGALGTDVRPDFLQTVAEIPDAHKVLHYLGNNMNEAARIAALPKVKMAIELAEIRSNISKPKQISQAPAPIKPVTGTGGGNADLADPNLSMEEYSRIRAKQRAERNK
jgi:hypothetical protein